MCLATHVHFIHFIHCHVSALQNWSGDKHKISPDNVLSDSTSVVPSGTWNCSKCTYSNTSELALVCGVCACVRDIVPGSAVDLTGIGDFEVTQPLMGWGNVHLRRCNEGLTYVIVLDGAVELCPLYHYQPSTDRYQVDYSVLF